MNIRIHRISSIAVLAVIAFLFNMEQVVAENVAFLPGDAFFHGTISQEILQKADQSKVVTINYVPHAPGSFSGNVGYLKLNLEIDDEAILKSLNSAYELVRLTNGRVQRIVTSAIYEEDVITILNEKVVEEEANPIRVFIYNRDTDIEKIHLCVKYNENWKQEIDAFGNRGNRPPAVDEFIKSYECLAESWSRAVEVPSLKATIPKTEIPKHQFVEEPIVCKASECLLIILPHGFSESDEELFKVNDGESIYTISQHGLKNYMAIDGHWESQVVPKVVRSKKPE